MADGDLVGLELERCPVLLLELSGFEDCGLLELGELGDGLFELLLGEVGVVEVILEPIVDDFLDVGGDVDGLDGQLELVVLGLEVGDSRLLVLDLGEQELVDVRAVASVD